MNPRVIGFSLVFVPLLLLEIAGAQNRVKFNNRNLFLSGMNIAWVNFAYDLGPNEVDTVQFKTIFQSISSAGGNSMRLWLHTNGIVTPAFNESGFVTGPGAIAIQNMKTILSIAKQYNLGLQLCLWSHDMLNQQQLDAVKLHRNAKLLTDTAYTLAYIRNSLVPMVQALKGNPAIVAWEIFNEPEGITNEFGWSGRDHIPIAAVQRAINLMTGAIHLIDPTAFVTSGVNSIQTLTDVNAINKSPDRMEFNQLSEVAQSQAVHFFNKVHRTAFTVPEYSSYLMKLAISPNYNYYRDDRLINAGGDSTGILDYYNVHFYGTSTQSPFNNPYSFWNLTKPLVAGEFYVQDSYGVPWQELYEKLFSTGYAGGFSWSWSDNYNNVQRSRTMQLMTSLFENHKRYIIVNPTTGIIYQFTAASKTIILGDSTTLFWDVEPGSTVTLDGNPVSVKDSIKVKPAITTSYILSATGENTSVSTVLISVLPYQEKYSFSLGQNYPNPFNASTIIPYSIGPETSRDNKSVKVILKVSDVMGREVAVLVNDSRPAGKYAVKLTNHQLSSGVYFYTLLAGDLVRTKKFVVLR